MPEILERGVTPSGFRWAIERDTPEETARRQKITFAQFCEMYPIPDAKAVREFADDPDRFGPEGECRMGFYLRTRVPDASGFFGVDARGAQWCAPEDWHRLYYEVRRAASPGLLE